MSWDARRPWNGRAAVRQAGCPRRSLYAAQARRPRPAQKIRRAAPLPEAGRVLRQTGPSRPTSSLFDRQREEPELDHPGVLDVGYHADHQAVGNFLIGVDEHRRLDAAAEHFPEALLEIAQIDA